MIQVTKRREKSHRASLLKTNDKSLLSRPLNLEHLDDRASSLHDGFNDILVDGLRVRCDFLQERLVGNDIQIRLIGIWVRVHEITLVHKVTTELLVGGGKLRRRAEGFYAVGLFGVGGIKIFFVDALLVLRARKNSDTGCGGVDVYGMIWKLS